jgi:hypothetical protein
MRNLKPKAPGAIAGSLLHFFDNSRRLSLTPSLSPAGRGLGASILLGERRLNKEAILFDDGMRIS